MISLLAGCSGKPFCSQHFNEEHIIRYMELQESKGVIPTHAEKTLYE